MLLNTGFHAYYALFYNMNNYKIICHINTCIINLKYVHMLLTFYKQIDTIYI